MSNKENSSSKKGGNIMELKKIEDIITEIGFIPMILFSFFLCLLSLLCGLLLLVYASWPLDFIGSLFFNGISIFFLYFILSYTYRYLADNGWFWLRVPEMTAAFVEKDRGLYQIFINVSGEDRQHYEHLARKRNKQHGYERIVLLGPDKQIVWIGPPWICRLKSPWYEYSEDYKYPIKEPVYFLDLRERTIDYTNIEDDKESGVIPSVDTRDAIQVKAYLVVSLKVWDPEAALYKIQHYLEAVQKEIVSRWRRAVSELSYFHSDQPVTIRAEDGSDEDSIKKIEHSTLEVNPQIQWEAHKAINEIILGKGLQGYDEHKEKRGHNYLSEHRVKYEKVQEDEIGYTDDFLKNSPAYRCLHSWGVLLLDIEVRDLDPTDKEMRQLIEGKSKSYLEAAAKLQQGIGERRYREEVAKGKLADEKLTRQGVAEGLEKIAEVTKTQGTEGLAALASDTAIRVVGGAKATLITEGGISGIIGQLLKTKETLEQSGVAQTKLLGNGSDRSGQKSSTSDASDSSSSEKT